MTAQNLMSSAVIRFPITLTSSIVCSTVRLMFFLLCVSEALTNKVASWNNSRTARALSSPRLLGMRTISSVVSGTSIPRRTSTPSESCGMTSGRTKLATSMRV